MWSVNEEKLLSAFKCFLFYLIWIVYVSETYQMYVKEFVRDLLEKGYLADILPK